MSQGRAGLVLAAVGALVLVYTAVSPPAAAPLALDALADDATASSATVPKHPFRGRDRPGVAGDAHGAGANWSTQGGGGAIVERADPSARDLIVNITKMTWAASDVEAARRFFMQYMPASKASDGCHPNCACGSQGRVEMNGSFACCQTMFGLHTVDAFSRPSGPLGIADIEKAYKKKLGSFSSYADVMDQHVGMYTLDLDSWIESFVSNDVDFIALKWQTVDGANMTSLVVGVPDAPTVVMEICSSNTPHILDTSTLAMSPRRFGSPIDQVRLAIPATATNLLIPLWASRATSNATRDVEWYEDIMAATVTYALDEDGVKYRYVSLNTAPKVFELHFVERAASKVGGYTVADIEGYYKEVHSATIHSPYCGFSVWMDNHFGVDMCGGYACPNVEDDDAQRALFMDGTLRKLRERAASDAPGAGSQYRIWRQMALNSTGRWIYNVYIVEPSGHALQLNGFLRNANDDAVPVWNESLCGQGTCSAMDPDGPSRAISRDPNDDDEVTSGKDVRKAHGKSKSAWPGVPGIGAW